MGCMNSKMTIKSIVTCEASFGLMTMVDMRSTAFGQHHILYRMMVRQALVHDVNMELITNNIIGPAGKILELLDRHPFRPAHIHLIAIKEGYKPITTQIFDSKSPYLEDDSVFAVKNSLLVDFVPLEGNKQAKLQLEYDIKLIPNGNST